MSFNLGTLRRFGVGFFVLALYQSILLLCCADRVFCISDIVLIKNIKQIYSVADNKLNISWTDSRSRPVSLVEIYDKQNKKVISKKENGSNIKFAAKLFHDSDKYKIQIKALSLSSFKQSRYIKKFTFSTRVRTKAKLGEFATTNSGGRTGTYFLPANYRFKTLPAILLFHGSSIAGKNVALIFKELAKKQEFIIVAPDSSDTRGWSYETDLSLQTEDQRHIEACLSELKAFPNLSIDTNHFLVAGISAGGELAAFYGSNDYRFTHFADLHGGIHLPSLGPNNIPLWLSTGTFDTLRSPLELQSYRNALPSFGFNDVTYREYSVAHEIPFQEREELVSWWLQR